MEFRRLAEAITSGFTGNVYAEEIAASCQEPELRDLIEVAMLNGSHYYNATNFLDGLHRVSEGNREAALHALVKARREKDAAFVGRFIGIKVLPLWLVQACRAAEEHGYEIPNEWVEQLKAAYALVPKEDIENAERLEGGFTLVGAVWKWFKERGE